MTLLRLENISKTFKQGESSLGVLDDITFTLEEGEIIALVGPSGSGKSTFLSIAGLLENPSSGKIYFNDRDCSKSSDRLRTKIRRESLGFIYQFHHLLPEFTALENVMIPGMLLDKSENEVKEEAIILLDSLGLKERLNSMPSELSGGEQQRVAIARSLINKPQLILADEPTGNLDNANAEKVINIIIKQARERKLSAIIVTHNVELAGKTDKVMTIRDGKIF
ncbi:lipoprotein releasing system ATP-binding protein [endosymbiont of Acanthamoeba sp. UWC8]|uniref:ABC transporter ATP-binding protein n=1 Tax=endosymbiont of Acanthamoeba sp. UWC8 TaxID=86106 RepID=UPI0004D1825D|nr:ABC transporter ATP-binding protein [endosymbiont of Acanthamoeba sp. UWC8]AIF81307.1 lipoprotein releasing system ATP-binding protein [endosymbiont of Acanthamoeba sp. UWC8]